MDFPCQFILQLVEQNLNSWVGSNEVNVQDVLFYLLRNREKRHDIMGIDTRKPVFRVSHQASRL